MEVKKCKDKILSRVLALYNEDGEIWGECVLLYYGGGIWAEVLLRRTC